MTAPLTTRDALVFAVRYDECHEEVTRRGELQPCENIAVAVRLDPNEGGPYPVCSRHARTPMVRLGDLRAALSVQRRGGAMREVQSLSNEPNRARG